MTGNRVVDLAAYDTDKTQGHLDNYAQAFGELFDQPMTLLELGVQRGGSMLLWRDLLPKAQIAGLDLNPVDVQDDTGRVRIYQGYQQDPVILDRIAAEVAPDGFDVVIDDASHVGQYTAASFWHLFPKHLKPGGMYILDDWSGGYWPHWTDGHAFTGDRATLGERRETASAPAEPSRAEGVRRRVRGAARPLAARLNRVPGVKQRVIDLYMRAEGSSLQRRFPSHDYGMVGFVKQLVDAAAIDVINAPKGRGAAPVSTAQVASVLVTPSQVFVRKVGSTGT